MRSGARVSVIIPALNEEDSIGRVIGSLPAWVDEVIVGDNGSTDETARRAAEAGARVVYEPRPGYGSACLAALDEVIDPDVVVFLDGDFSDHPEEAGLLVDPIVKNEADFVVGSRTMGSREQGALLPQALFGNKLSCALIRLFWNVRFTDLGPFRAIRYGSLQRLGMADPDYGWTVEMQIKAAQHGLRTREVPVSYRRRVGKSKVSGTLRGVFLAGTTILGTIFRAALTSPPESSSLRERIIVFTRMPETGKVKTRLIPALGEAGAANLHRSMAEAAVSRMRSAAVRRSAIAEIRYEGGHGSEVREWLGRDLLYHRQGDGDLGRRMFTAIQSALRTGAERVVLVGTDVPDLSEDIAVEALESLRTRDLVIGPAKDGGYYLIGMKRPCPEFFSGIEWGADTVLGTTLRIAESLGLSVHLLPELSDVDRPEDLPAVPRTCGPEVPSSCSALAEGRISVIIPTLNEGEFLPGCLESVRAADDLELIVVDGGSEDNTVEKARAAGAAVIESPRGRAVQMNLAAARATGDILLFLHADTRLPPRWNTHVRCVLGRQGTVAGAFRLSFDRRLPGLRLIQGLANLRTRLLHMPYGDQALFLTAETFRRLGGFPDMPIMEDFAFVRSLRKIGSIGAAPAAVTTSARRWIEHGVRRTTAVHQLIIIGYYVGLPLDRIARMRGKRDR